MSGGLLGDARCRVEVVVGQESDRTAPRIDVAEREEPPGARGRADDARGHPAERRGLAARSVDVGAEAGPRGGVPQLEGVVVGGEIRGRARRERLRLCAPDGAAAGDGADLREAGS
jgi:hypothetical protein